MRDSPTLMRMVSFFLPSVLFFKPTGGLCLDNNHNSLPIQPIPQQLFLDNIPIDRKPLKYPLISIVYGVRTSHKYAPIWSRYAHSCRRLDLVRKKWTILVLVRAICIEYALGE